MKRLRLDRVWWLVTPGNPLKDPRGLAPLDDRMVAARKLARHPRILVMGLEAEIGTRYTYETIEYLAGVAPGSLRLDNGSGQPAQLSSLAEMAGDCCAGTHRHHRPVRPEPLCQCQRRGPVSRTFAHPGGRGPIAARPQAAGVGLPARAQVATLLHRVARGSRRPAAPTPLGRSSMSSRPRAHGRE